MEHEPHRLADLINCDPLDRLLIVFDIDHTLFRPVGSVGVRRADGTVRRLTNDEFVGYLLGRGETFDFSDFASSELFSRGEPIDRMIDLCAHTIRMHAYQADIRIVTARSDLDDRDAFLLKFRRHGIDVDRTHVVRAGNHGYAYDSVNKFIAFHDLLARDKYDTAVCFDDQPRNLAVFKSMEAWYPQTRFHSFLVKEDGDLEEATWQLDPT